MRTIVFSVLIVAVFSLRACSGDDSSSETPRLFNTSWTRVITDENLRFKVRLDFREQTFGFVLLEDTPGHHDSSGRLEVLGREFVLNKDVDCEGPTGRYA